MEEIWKDIKDYEGYYQVSDLGNIRSLDRIIHTKNQGGNYSKIHKGRILKSTVSNRGYYIITFSNFGRKTFSVHQLVAIAFLNHKPCGLKIIVDHKDNNPLNNQIDNLQLISNRENQSKDKKGCSSKYVGVNWFKRESKWRAGIQINKNNIHLGLFEKEIDAHNAYQKALNNHLNNK